MARGRPKTTLVLSNEERAELVGFVRSRSVPAALSTRAKIILASADGEANTAIAARLQLNPATVRKWRTQFIERRIKGLYSEARPGKPRSIDADRLAGLINVTLQTKPEGARHWSVRAVAGETAISKTSVHRYFKLFGLQPHRGKAPQRSTAALAAQAIHDVVGLYLSPPGNALVLCGDEKGLGHAPERTAAPRGMGPVEGVVHNCLTQGTTTLFAALGALNGAAPADDKPGHRPQDYLSFLRAIDLSIPAGMSIHCVVDNVATHLHPKVDAWLAAKPRWNMHFVPTYSCWLEQVERFFALIADKTMHRGSFSSVRGLVAQIDDFSLSHDKSCKSFAWTATAYSLLAKMRQILLR